MGADRRASDKRAVLAAVDRELVEALTQNCTRTGREIVRRPDFAR